MLSMYLCFSAARVWRTHSWSSVPRARCTGQLAWRRVSALPDAVRHCAIAAVCLLAIPVLASAQQSPAANGVSSPDSISVLRPGDVIRLRIWREPDLSGDFPVDPTGVAVLPKIGPTAVTNQFPAALKTKLIAAYAEYLNHPSIEVTFLRRVQVLGAVRNPGLYPVDPTMTIGDAVALAGGATPDGDSKRLALIRNGVKLPHTLSHGTRIADSRIQSGDEIFVPERSWMSRNPGIVATMITATVSLFVALRH